MNNEYAIFQTKAPKTHNERLASNTIETMRKNIAVGKAMGVTVSGNRLTVRWNDEHGRLQHVHMIIEHVAHPDLLDGEL